MAWRNPIKSGQFQDAKKTYQLFYDQFKTDPLIPHVHWKIGFCDYRLGGLGVSETLRSFSRPLRIIPFPLIPTLSLEKSY